MDSLRMNSNPGSDGSLYTSINSESSSPSLLERRKKEEELKQLWEQNGHLYITEAAFNSCYKKIKDWINISTLMGHLMANGLVCGPEEVERVSSPYVPMGTRKMNLLELTKANGGRHGFFILYKCLRDSASDMPLGHGDAIEELEDYARQHPVSPPWARGSTNSMPTFSTMPLADDSCSELGGQSMSSLESHQPEYLTMTSIDSDRVSSTCVQPSTGVSTASIQPPASGAGTLTKNLAKKDDITKPILSQPATHNIDVMTTIHKTTEATCKNLDSIDSISILSSAKWTGPKQETHRWDNNAATAYVGDNDSERDGPGAQQELSTLHKEVQDHVRHGDISILYEKYSQTIDMDCIDTADCRTKSDFMDQVCKFVCASLNSRDPVNPKLGVLLGGVTFSEDGDSFVVSGFLDEKSREAIKKQFSRVLQSTVSVLEEERKTQLSQDELGLVSLDITKCQDSFIALITVQPSWHVCTKRVYCCCFKDGSGKPKNPEVYRRSAEATVRLKHKIRVTELQNVLNNGYDSYSGRK